MSPTYWPFALSVEINSHETRNALDSRKLMWRRHIKNGPPEQAPVLTTISVVKGERVLTGIHIHVPTADPSTLIF